MENSFFAYLQQLELMTFFSGYPLLYTLILFIAGNKKPLNNFRNRMIKILPFSYALVGTLYLGLELKNLYLSYSLGNVKQIMLHPYLMIWGLLSILFWIPAISKKKELSLIHSLVFFFFLVKDVILQLGSSADKYMLGNDIRIYTISLLLNLGAFFFLLLLSFLLFQNKKKFRT